MDINQEIVKYYDYTLPYYQIFWHRDANAIHYGLWDEKTKNLKESLINTNKFLAEKVCLKSNDYILDAGCGIGGSAIWIAKNIGAKVVGITTSKRQVEKAKILAEKFGVDRLVNFYEKDYINSGFQNAIFDVVWAIESVCYTQNKLDFLKEAYRILKPTGRIIIADGFLNRPVKNEIEKAKIKSFLEGLIVPNLETSLYFKELMEKVGFKNIVVWDKTREILPSAKRIYKMSCISYPISKITEKLGITSKILTKNNKAGIDQLYLFENRIITYQVFYGEKI